MTTSFKPAHIIGGFKGSGLYPINKSVLTSRIVSAQPAMLKPNEAQLQLENVESTPKNRPTLEDPEDVEEVGLLPGSSELLSVPGPSRLTQNLSFTTPSREVQVVNPLPMKKLREAILSTISPEQSLEVKSALNNSKQKRRRVQGSCGEVLTSAEVEQRLKDEEEVRKEKKKKSCIKALGKKIKQEKDEMVVVKK